MLEPAVVFLRLAQYAGAMILLGSSLFFIYALPASGAASAARLGWSRPLLTGAAALLAITALLGIAAQSALLAGSVTEGIKVETLSAVVTGMDLGKAAVVRAAAAFSAAILMLLLRPSRTSWVVAATLGTVATASLAWMGHGAATEGPFRGLHLASDILHVLAAAVWFGALATFCGLLLVSQPTAEFNQALHQALRGFSGVGSGLVAVLAATGLVNTWILVGPDNLEALSNTAYGQLLSLKLLLFLGMLGFAATNRFRLTPAFERAQGRWLSDAAIAPLRRSVAFETLLGFAVLLLVAWLGTLAPPASG